MINQCYPAIFYSYFPIKTLTQITLINKQLFDRRQKQKLHKVGYKHYKTCQITYLLYLAMQQIRLVEPLVPRACITATSPVSLSNIGSLVLLPSQPLQPGTAADDNWSSNSTLKTNPLSKALRSPMPLQGQKWLHIICQDPQGPGSGVAH